MKKMLTQVAAIHAAIGLVWLIAQLLLGLAGVNMNGELVQYANIAAMLGGCIFLLMTGKTMPHPLQRRIFLIFFSLFLVTIILQFLRLNDIIELMFVMWMVTLAMTLLVLAYIVNFFIRKPKTVLDVLKVCWIITASCGLLIFRKLGIPLSGLFTLLSFLFYFVMMGLALYRYYIPKSNG